MECLLEMDKRCYDNAKDHLGSGFPDALPMEQAYVHIGMYLGWVIETGLYSGFFAEEGSTEIFRFKRKEISCSILSRIWNGYLAVEFFNTTGNKFTVAYYATGLYRRDYEEILGKDVPTLYHVNDTWSNYEQLKTRIDLRYQEWYKLKSLLRDVRKPGRGEAASNATVTVYHPRTGK